MNKKIISICIVLIMMGISISIFANEYYIPDLFVGFESEEEIKQAENEGYEFEDIQHKTGVYYFMKANQSYALRQRKQFLEKSIQIFEGIWRKDRSNNKCAILLAYSYLALCDTDIGLEQVIDNVSRAKNLLNLVISRSPQNIDARLGRTHININLSPQMGRPDDIILGDVEVYNNGYCSLSDKEKEREDLKSGYMVMQLAAAVVMDYRSDKEMALEYFKNIDQVYLQADNLIKLYKKLEEKYGGK